MVNLTYALEATTLYNKMLGWNMRPMSRVLMFGALPASHLNLSSIGERSNVSYPREFERIASRSRFFVNAGDSNVVTPEHRNVPAHSVTARPRILESTHENNNEYVAMSFDEVTHKASAEGIAHFAMLLETCARAVQLQIDKQYFEIFTEEQTIDGIISTNGFDDGVTEYPIETDLTTKDEETAKLFVNEISERITAMKQRAPGNTLDNFVVHVPMSVISYLHGFWDRSAVRSVNPNDPAQHYNPSDVANADGILFIGYETDILGESVTPVGTYGYLNNRAAIKFDFDNRNDPAYAVRNTMMPAESFYAAILAEMNAKGLQYDYHSRKVLADLQANKGFHMPGSVIPGNMYRVSFYHLGGDVDNFGVRVDIVLRPTRLMPKGMERLIFNAGLLPNATKDATKGKTKTKRTRAANKSDTEKPIEQLASVG